MSGFMRQLKQNNNSQFKKYKYKQSIKTNQGSVVSLQSTLVKNIPQSCCANCKLIQNTPNNPRSINKLYVGCCSLNCNNTGCCTGKESTYKNRNMSNKNLVNQRILSRSKNETCKKNVVKQYSSNSEFIDQLKSHNINYCNPSSSVNCCNPKTNSVKNMNTLNSSDYITLYRSSLVATNNLCNNGLCE